VWFKGREFLHKELGKVLMSNIYVDLKDFGKVETLPKNEGKSIVTILIPLTLKESVEISCV
jgi:translation initiation factor IF-3